VTAIQFRVHMTINIKEYVIGKTYSTHMEDDIDGSLIVIVFTSPPVRNKSMHYICVNEEIQPSNAFRRLFERPSLEFWPN
jgi:hypothetical protein